VSFQEELIDRASNVDDREEYKRAQAGKKLVIVSESSLASSAYDKFEHTDICRPDGEDCERATSNAPWINPSKAATRPSQR
jgi:hypothetical protein